MLLLWSFFLYLLASWVSTVQFDIYINPGNSDQSVFSFRSLNEGFEFVKIVIMPNKRDELQVNFWLSRGSDHLFPDLAVDYLDFSNFTKARGISFSSSDTNGSLSMARILINGTHSSLLLMDMNVTFANLSIETQAQVLTLSGGLFVLNRSMLIFYDLTLQVRMNTLRRALFYAVNSDLDLWNIEIMDSRIENESSIFYIFNDDWHDLSFRVSNLWISTTSVINASLFSFLMDSKYTIQFNNTHIHSFDCSRFCQALFLQKSYYGNSNGDNLGFGYLIINQSNFTEESNFIIAKNLKAQQDFCSINIAFSKSSFAHNQILNSQLIYFYREECFTIMDIHSMSLWENSFLSSVFIKMPAFKVLSLIAVSNNFTDSSLFENFETENHLIGVGSLILSHMMILDNKISVKSLFSIEYYSNVEISHSFLARNPEETIFLVKGTNLTKIFRLSIRDSLNRNHFSLLNNKILDFRDIEIKNQELLPMFYEDLRERGGSISITTFKQLFVFSLRLEFLVALNTNIFEIRRDNTQDSDQSIEVFEIHDCWIAGNTILNRLYPVSIFNLMIGQLSAGTFHFLNISFVNNTIESITPNQINNAICFLLISLDAKVLFESMRVNNPIASLSYYQSSLVYLNTNQTTLRNCSFSGLDSDDQVYYERLHHIKIYSTIIKVFDCNFVKMGSENGGGLFLSSIGSLNSQSQILINNSVFAKNIADSGGGIFFSDPEYLSQITISNCSFIGNTANYGSVFFLDYEDDDDSLSCVLNFQLIDCFFHQEVARPTSINGIYFRHEGNFIVQVFNCVFRNFSSKLLFLGQSDPDYLLQSQIDFKGCEFSHSTIKNKDLFSVPISSLKVSQYLAAVEIRYVSTVSISDSIFLDIDLNISDVNFLDLTSFLLMVGTNMTISFSGCNFSNFIYFPSQSSSQSHLGILSFLSEDTDDDVLKNLITIHNLSFENSSYVDLFEDEDDPDDQLNFIGGGVFVLGGNLSISSSQFKSLTFMKGVCVSARSSVLRILGSDFESNSALDYASIAYIDNGDLILEGNVLVNNTNMLQCLGEGDIKILGNQIFTIDLNLENLRGIINFSYENIFVYGRVQPPSLEYKDSMYYQSFACQGKDFDSGEVFSETVNITLNNTSGMIRYESEIAQFAIEPTSESMFLFIPPEMIGLEISKQRQNSKKTTISLAKNSFNISKVLDSNDPASLFLISYYDFKSQIFTNILTQRESPKYSSQIYLIGIEIRQCPTGSLYNESFQNCTPCQSGSFSVDPLDSSCLRCPSIANCENGVLSAKEHYWRSSIFSSKLYFCKANPRNCLGGVFSDCRGGSLGPKCESCDYQNGYVRKLNYECSRCDSGITFDFIFGLLLFLVQIVFFLVYIYSWIRTIELTKEDNSNLERTELVRHKKRLNIYIDVLSNYLQIIALIATLKTEKFPNFLNEFLDLTIPTAIIDTKYCAFLHIDPKNIVYVDLGYIILVPIFKSLLIVLFWLILRWKCRRIKINRNHLILGLICLYRFEVIGQAYELFSFVSCQQIDGTLYMMKDSQFTCDFADPDSLFFKLFWSLMLPFIIIWVFIIPCLIFIPLVKSKKMNELEHEETLERYGVLYIGYKKEFYYWELFKLLSKILFVLIAKFILFDPGKIILIITVFCAYALALHEFKPYHHNHFNRVEILSSLVYIASFLLFIYGEYSILYGSMDNTYDSEGELVNAYDLIFSVINYTMNGAFLLYLFYKIIFALKQKTSKYYLKFKEFIKKRAKKAKNEREMITDQLLEPGEMILSQVEDNPEEILETFDESKNQGKHFSDGNQSAQTKNPSSDQ